MTAAPVALVSDFGLEEDVFVSAPLDAASLDALLKETPACATVTALDAWDPTRPATPAEIRFSRLRHFGPEHLVEEVAPWRRMRVLRSHLHAFKAVFCSVPAVPQILRTRIGDEAARIALRAEIGLADDPSWRGIDVGRDLAAQPPALREALARIDALDADAPDGAVISRVLTAAHIDEESAHYEAVMQGARAMIVELVSPERLRAPFDRAAIEAVMSEIDARLSTVVRAALGDVAFTRVERPWRVAAWLTEHAPVVLAHVRTGSASPEELVEHANAVGAFDLVLDGDFDLDHDAEALLSWGRAVSASGGRVWFDARWDPDIVTESGNAWERARSHRDGAALWPCAPKALLRLPFGPETSPVKSFDFEEEIDTRGSCLRWGLAGAVAAALARAPGEPDAARVEVLASESAGPLQHGLSDEEVAEVEARAGVTCLRAEGSRVYAVTPPAAIDRARVDAVIADLDARLSAQLREILRHPVLRRLEAAWRSVEFVVERVDFSQNIAVELLNCSKDDLAIDFEDSPEVVKSGLYKRVHEAAFEASGARPYGLLVGDYAFGPGADDLALLRRISLVASMAHAPFVASAAPSMFGIDAWDRLAAVDDFEALFADPRYAGWRALRESEESRYVGLTLPRIMLRAPYGAQTSAVETFAFEEDVVDHDQYLWGGAAAALATRVADSFARYRWCPNIVGADGVVEGVGLHPRDATADARAELPVECAVFDAQQRALAEAGLIALGFDRASTRARFVAASSVQRTRAFGLSFEARAAETTARLGAQLPYLFIASRFAHYLKALRHDRLDELHERDDIERALNAWIREHVADTDDTDPELRARRPLRSARVAVEEVERQHGWYRMTLTLRPHFDFEGAPFELTLVGKLDRA